MNEEQKELERNLRLIRELSKVENFQVWRDTVVVPIIGQIEAELSSEKADQMSEVVLRSKLKQLNSLKYIFNDVFEIAKMNLKDNK